MFEDRSASMLNRVWCIDPDTLRKALDTELPDEKPVAQEGDARQFALTASGAAIIPITGLMTKGESFATLFGFGTNTLRTRAAVRAAAADDEVTGIMLFIDSPGGEVAGTDELGEEIRAANRIKPVFAFIEDLGASAALWVASQAGTVFSNRMAEVGSIGVFTVIVDASEAAEREGLKVHVISTGDFKGSALGAPVSEEKIAEVQRIVDAINIEFKAAVKRGRGMSAKAVDAIADGRVFMAPRAEELGLTDGVRTLERALIDLDKAVRAKGRASRSRALAARVEVEKRK